MCSPNSCWWCPDQGASSGCTKALRGLTTLTSRLRPINTSHVCLRQCHLARQGVIRGAVARLRRPSRVQGVLSTPQKREPHQLVFASGRSNPTKTEHCAWQAPMLHGSARAQRHTRRMYGPNAQFRGGGGVGWRGYIKPNSI